MRISFCSNGKLPICSLFHPQSEEMNPGGNEGSYRIGNVKAQPIPEPGPYVHLFAHRENKLHKKSDFTLLPCTTDFCLDNDHHQEAV